MLLKKYKNRLFLLMNELSLDVSDFVKREEEGKFILCHKISSFEFSIRFHNDDYHLFDCLMTTFAPGNKVVNIPNETYCGFDKVEELFQYWIIRDLGAFLAEESEIDMWDQSNNYLKTATIDKIDFDDNSPFDEIEKEQVKLGIGEAKSIVINSFKFSAEQVIIINKRFDYLEKAIDRNNKTDWKSIAISTILGLIMNLGVDTNTGKGIWDLFLKVFQNLPMLPMPN